MTWRYNQVLRAEEDVRQAARMLGQEHPHHPAKAWDLLRAVHYIDRFVPDRWSPILDAGCADSPVADVLHARGYRCLYGCDLTDKGVSANPDFRFTRASVCETPYAGGQFAAVTCISVVEHGVPLADFFREMSRIIRTGGHLLISTDYFDPKVSTRDVDPSVTFGLPWNIFDRREADALIEEARSHGFRLYEPVDWECGERVVQWSGQAYAFVFLAFQHVAA